MPDALHHPDDKKGQSILDSVTGLVNGQEFERRVRRVLLTFSQENDTDINEEHALFRIDLEQFALVNEDYGHLAGDALLRQFTCLLQYVVRVRDTLAYLGGNEFGVLMEHCSLNHAHRVADKILQQAQGFQFFHNDHCFDISVSIGIVPITKQTGNFVELSRHANVACNRAKDLNNKSAIHLHSENHFNSTSYRGEPSWVADIYQALEEDRFLIFIQPIVPLKEREAAQVHYELLVRMCDKAGKLVLPNQFLPALERYSMSSVLDRWVIHKAFQMIAGRPDFLVSAQFFSINLSGQSLVNHELSGYILNALAEFGIPAEKVCFEITETSAISNFDAASDFIQILKQKGCRFSLDDFGSGFSSLLYLKNLPVDYLKIDGSFIKNITSESIDYAMVRSISEMGQSLGMATVAEYVESQETLQLLKDIGVDYAQGDSVGEPLPLAAFFSEMPQRVT